VVAAVSAPAWPDAGHLVQFYGSDDELAHTLADFALDGLVQDHVTVVVATPEHRGRLLKLLDDDGVDLVAAEAAGGLIMEDAAALLARFFDGDHSDPAAFDSAVGGLVRAVAATGRPVRIYGEMVALLWDDGLVAAALELEELWNTLGESVTFTLLCGYPSEVAATAGDAVERICLTHSATLGRPGEEASQDFDGDASTPAAARRFVASTVRSWDCAALGDDLTLIASELATNAMRYAGSALTLRLTRISGGVRLSVLDSSAATPVPGAPTANSGSGRGLLIVNALASRWGFDRTSTGKVVWAECTLDPQVD
jgi:anti-sigma regulatory factor (Ser/Thr protein kinase)